MKILNFKFSRVLQPGTDQSCRSGWADGVLPLPATQTYQEGLTLETGILGFQDSVVPISGRKERIQFIPPQPSTGQRSQYQFQGAARAPPITEAGQRGQTMGRGRGRGLQAGTLRVQGHVYAITPSAESIDQPVIQGTFLLSRLWVRVLFDFGVLHSFIAESIVIELDLEVEALEEPLYVSSLLGIRARIGMICHGCELEISKILLTVDPRVMDM